MPTVSSAQTPNAEPRRIRRQLAVAFAGVWLLAAGASAVQLAFLQRLGRNLDEMRRDEAAIRDSARLASSIREQYIHIAHCLVHGDTTHLSHYEEWERRVQEETRALERSAPPDARARVRRVGEVSRTVDELFRREVVPALDRGDPGAARVKHPRIEQLSMGAASEADKVATDVEARMAHAHSDAIAVAGFAWGSGLVGAALLALIATALLLRMRGTLLRPLETLTGAAQRLGAGDFDVRVGDLGRGELAMLARAFDAMASRLRDNQRRLVASERMAAIGQLAAGVAHEINNPIAVIRGYLKTMMADAGEPLRPELEILDQEADACQRIAEDLLAYARAGELRPERTRMDDLVRKTVLRYCEAHGRAPTAVELELQPGSAVVDPVRVRQVLSNLLENAFDASRDDPPEVQVTGEPVAGGYRFGVADRGHGLPSSDRGRAFEPFFSSRPDGTGLGLAVCKGIAEAHGGTIELLERDSGGLTAVVTLYDQPVSLPEADD
jgi:signal transduction histidine kinase